MYWLLCNLLVVDVKSLYERLLADHVRIIRLSWSKLEEKAE